MEHRRLSFRGCRIGLPEDSAPGWLVVYAGCLLAVLSEAPDGRVSLAAGFREPFVCVTIDWTDFAMAKADFTDVVRLYRAGVIPGMIEMTFRTP